MNNLIYGQTAGHNRYVEADCTAAARALAANHLAGPTASAALAEGLVAAALLSADLGTPEEAVTLYIQTSGVLGSLLVEATYEGTLRGYTGKKVINELDETLVGNGATNVESALDAAFGVGGTCSVMASLPGKVLAQSSETLVGVPRPKRALDAYFKNGAQREVKSAIVVALDAEGRIAKASGGLYEQMPGADAAEFAALEPQAIVERQPGTAPADATVRPLRFACRCSLEKAQGIVAALPAEDREKLRAQNKPIDIYCHMCGKSYAIDLANSGS